MDGEGAEETGSAPPTTELLNFATPAAWDWIDLLDGETYLWAGLCGGAQGWPRSPLASMEPLQTCLQSSMSQSHWGDLQASS